MVVIQKCLGIESYFPLTLFTGDASTGSVEEFFIHPSRASDPIAVYSPSTVHDRDGKKV